MARIKRRFTNVYHRTIHEKALDWLVNLFAAYDDLDDPDDIDAFDEEILRAMDDVEQTAPVQIGPFENPITWETITPQHCLKLTGLDRLTIATIADHLIPDQRVATHRGRSSVPRRDAILVLTAVLRNPGFRWRLTDELQMHEDRLSRIARSAALYLKFKWAKVLSWPKRLVRRRVREYTRAVRRRFRRTGIHLRCTVAGFIDCHIRRTCRPVRMQRALWTRFKRCHGLKVQTVALPDGIMCASRAFAARVHDYTLMRKTRICRRVARDLDGARLASDGGYQTNGQILRTPPNCPQFSATRVLVEWIHDDIMKMWPALEFKRFQRVLLTIPAAFYAAAVILRNAVVCVSGHGGQVAGACRLQPPQLAELFDHRDALPVFAADLSH